MLYTSILDVSTLYLYLMQQLDLLSMRGGFIMHSSLYTSILDVHMYM